MTSFLKPVFLICMFLGVLNPQSVWAASALEMLPIQDGGRVKPFDTFAREHLALIFGKEKFEGKPATEIVLTWVLQPDAWQDKTFFEIRHHLVKKGLKLDEKRMLFSPQEILSSDRLSVLMRDLAAKRDTKEKLDPYFQGIQRLENQLFTFREIASGRMLRLVPPKEGESWVALNELGSPFQEKFMQITKEFVSSLNPENKKTAEANLTRLVDEWVSLAQAENPALYPNMTKVRAEVSYNNFHPFRWAYTSYILALVFMGFFWMFNKPSMVTVAWVLSGVGILLHLYGFSIRTYLTERAPVTNMYETVVWVSFGTVVFAMIIEAIYRWKFVLTAGVAVGAFCLILADMAPVVLDSTLQPLEPVLRSNFWLTTHVLTITISYAAFFLAFALGDFGLFLFLKDEKANRERIGAITLALYRSVQIGVAFLGPGIILGGIWADYSWGRFWGWDPKETWALIALLGYLAMLHGRLAGILKNFGMCAAAILTFSLVIMAWYGVNYVLGAGLHSYGFGAGGVEYVAGFVAIHILYVIFVAIVRRDHLRT